MTGELTAIIVAMATLLWLVAKSIFVQVQRRIGIQPKAARSESASAHAHASDEIVWCVVGIGAQHDLLHHRVTAPSYDLAAAAAMREVRGLHRVVGVSPVTLC